jgi:hypothetical protein
MLSREHLWCSGSLFDITFASIGLKVKEKADDSEARPFDDAVLCCLRVTSRVLEASLIKIKCHTMDTSARSRFLFIAVEYPLCMNP